MSSKTIYKGAPRKKVSGYSLFIKDLGNPNGVSLSEYSSYASTEWKNAIPETRARYNGKAEALREEYRGSLPPKREPTPYIKYASTIRPQLKKDNPDMSFGDLSRTCGQMWKDLPLEEKMTYGHVQK